MATLATGSVESVRRRRLLAVAVVVFGSPILALWFPVLEAVGSATGAACVWLAAVSDPWTWPIGIANNLLYLVVFWRAGLYADALLQLVFAAISVYGIWRWRAGAGGGAPLRPITRGSRLELGVVLVAIVATGFALHALLDRATDSTVPGWDGATTAVSLGAQWLLSRRVIETWWLWIGVDLVYVPLYVHKGLIATAGLYAVYLLLCVVGLVDWRREMRGTAAVRSAPR